MADSNLNNLPVSNGQVDEEGQTLQLADLWALVWDHKWWYVFSILAALLLAGFYLYKTPKTYSRTEKVIVDEDTQASMMRDLTSFAGTARRVSSGTNVDNEIEALRAPDIMEKVVARLGLETAWVSSSPLLCFTVASSAWFFRISCLPTLISLLSLHVMVSLF